MVSMIGSVSGAPIGPVAQSLGPATAAVVRAATAILQKLRAIAPCLSR